MSPSGVSIPSILSFLVLIYFRISYAANVTEILKGYPDFSKMNNVLSQPDVAKQMNLQPAITILGIDNAAMDTLSATKRPEEVTDIVKCHVAFDYYDEPKLNNRPLNKPAEMVNLYQSSGSSQYGQGLTRLKKTSQGIFFFSTSRNSSRNDAKFVEKVYTRQFNLSIIRLDHPIYISGLNDDMAPALAPLPPPAAPNKTAVAPAPEEVVAESPTDDLITEAPAPAPAEGPTADEAPSSKEADADDQASDDHAATSSAGRSVAASALVFASTFLAAVAL